MTLKALLKPLAPILASLIGSPLGATATQLMHPLVLEIQINPVFKGLFQIICLFSTKFYPGIAAEIQC